MKIAIASSGLGHITRGIETWALDTANALHRQGIDTTLFAASAIPKSIAPQTAIPCWRRNAPFIQTLTRIAPACLWRWHLKSNYNLEQWSFWRHLKHHLRRDRFDLLHVQDPMLAYWAMRAHQRGRLQTQTLLAHGTEESPEFCFRFPNLQHLAPWHLEQTLAKQAQVAPHAATQTLRHWYALPNFVDTNIYKPADSPAQKAALRRDWRIPDNATLIGTAAAVKSHHKRIDWLIAEFAQAARSNPNLHLIIAGSRTQETPPLMTQAEKTAPGRITFLINHPHHQMADYYRMLDAFVLTSLFEMMPIALLEACASGLPAITNQHPVLEWMTGPGGIPINMAQDGQLCHTLLATTPQTLVDKGRNARQHAIDTFSEEQVIRQYIQAYHEILNAKP